MCAYTEYYQPGQLSDLRFSNFLIIIIIMWGFFPIKYVNLNMHSFSCDAACYLKKGTSN